jgi:membrane protein DedA with SNARE-associated domain
MGTGKVSNYFKRREIEAKGLLRFIILPLVFLVIFVVFVQIYKVLGLPSAQGLVDIAKHYYLEHGYITVFIAAIIEGLLVVNWYLPGSFVIVLGVIFSIGDPLRAVAMVAIITFAFFLTSVINYTLGRYAWYKFLLFLGLRVPLEKMKQKVKKHGLFLIFTTYFHPNIGALTALSCGILRLSFSKFLIYSLGALILWNTLWGFIVYLAGVPLLKLLHVSMLIAALVSWLIFGIARFIFQSCKKQDIEN